MTNKRRLLEDLRPPDLTRGTKTQGLSESMLETLLRQGARPGDKLPTEHELAELFGVSRPTVRQALKSLDAAGLVESKPRRGTVLKAADMRSLAPWFGAHLMLALATGEHDADTPADPYEALRVLAEARWTLERALAPVAARRRTDEDLAAMARAEADFRQAADGEDAQAAIDADAAFHRAYIAAAHNPVLSGMSELIDGYFEALARLREREGHTPPNPELRAHTAAEHGAIREALLRRDADAVVRVLDTHLGRTLLEDR